MFDSIVQPASESIFVPDVEYPVLPVVMKVDNDVVCDLYNSCKKNPFVSNLASGQSAQAFLEFVGANAV